MKNDKRKSEKTKTPAGYTRYTADMTDYTNVLQVIFIKSKAAVINTAAKDEAKMIRLISDHPFRI